MKVSIYRAAQKSGVLTVPCHAEKTLFSVCLLASSQRMQQLGSFSFSGNRDLFSCHLCLFLCPAGSSEPAMLSDSRGPVFGQVVHC